MFEDAGVGALGRPRIVERPDDGPEDLFARADRAHLATCGAQLEFLRAIGDVDRTEAWVDEGARDTAHWVWMRYGISHWKALRWVAASRALEHLPRLAEALGSGVLGLDKVVELARSATPGTERDLITWAQGVSAGAIRHLGNMEARRERAEEIRSDQDRSLRWWYHEEGRRFGLTADLPAAQGAVVANALERVAQRVPDLPTDADHPYPVEARTADALVALCSARLADDPDPDRATVVVHAPLQALHGSVEDAPSAELEGGRAVIPAATVRRLACNARLQVVAEDVRGEPIALGRLTRTPSPAMVRLVRHRDRGCVFPGCGSTRFTEAHHIVWWRSGGRTDLENLVLICSFHHRVVHEQRWSLRREPNGTVSWYRPNGVRYRAGPAPPAMREPA